MQSNAKTVDEYLAALPEDRCKAISAIRDVILENLPEGYEEGMQYGMIGYFVPHSLFPQGYHCDPKQPLNYVALASQKNHMAIYLMGCYGDESTKDWFVKAWTGACKKLDMGASCVRFKKLDDVPLSVVGEAVAKIPVRAYLDRYLSVLATMKSRQKRT